MEIAGKISKADSRKLLAIVKESVEMAVREGKSKDFLCEEAALQKKAGAFVTLHKYGSLRGCIGRMQSSLSLCITVRDMAIAAATSDYRFDPVRPEELPDLDYEISVITEPQPIDDWKKIELGRHGVIISRGRHSGVYLPQVATETGWTLEEFLQSLCVEKAGLDKFAYKDRDTVIEVFEVQVIR
jgi:AmmeMemoRadiSam system protein A